MSLEYKTVLRISGSRQSGKSSALIGGGITVAKAHPGHAVIYASPSFAQTRSAKRRHGEDAPQNFLWHHVFTKKNLAKLGEIIESTKATLVLLDEAQSMPYPGASRLAHRLSELYKVSVWFVEEESDRFPDGHLPL